MANTQNVSSNKSNPIPANSLNSQVNKNQFLDTAQSKLGSTQACQIENQQAQESNLIMENKEPNVSKIEKQSEKESSAKASEKKLKNEFLSSNESLAEISQSQGTNSQHSQKVNQNKNQEAHQIVSRDSNNSNESQDKSKLKEAENNLSSSQSDKILSLENQTKQNQIEIQQIKQDLEQKLEQKEQQSDKLCNQLQLLVNQIQQRQEKLSQENSNMIQILLQQQNKELEDFKQENKELNYQLQQSKKIIGDLEINRDEISKELKYYKQSYQALLQENNRAKNNSQINQNQQQQTLQNNNLNLEQIYAIKQQMAKAQELSRAGNQSSQF